MSLLVVDGLTVVYPGAGRPAVAGVSFEIEAGRTLAVVGESGSGKTTLALALAGLLDPRARRGARRLEVNGEDLLSAGRKRWRQLRRTDISFVFQSPVNSWNPTRTMKAQVKDGMAASGRAGRMPELYDLLGRVGFEDPERRLEDLPHQLSGGMLQRVSIAVAVIREPALLIADEPTSALDSTVQSEILAILGELRREVNLAMLVISHDLSVVSRVADDVMVMYGGKAVELGSRRNALHSAVHPYTKGLLDSVPSLDGERKTLLPSMAPGPLPAAGCPFAPRCGLAVDECRRTEPDLAPVGATLAACPPAAAASTYTSGSPSASTRSSMPASSTSAGSPGCSDAAGAEGPP